MSVLNQLLVVLVLMMLAPGLGVHLPVVQFMVVLMLVFLVSSLPISLGGLGAREGAMMALMLPLGVDAASVLALSVAYLLVLWCITLPGAFMLLLREPMRPLQQGCRCQAGYFVSEKARITVHVSGLLLMSDPCL